MSLTQTNEIENHNKADPALKLYFLSHGTLESRDLAFSRRFYEKFLGLEVVQTSPISLLIRLGGNSTIAVVYSRDSAIWTSSTTMDSTFAPGQRSMKRTAPSAGRRKNGG